MHRRDQQYCKFLKILFIKKIKKKLFALQWTYGGLNTETILLLIEASTPEGDDQKLQTGMNAVDKCSQISALIFSKHLQKKKKSEFRLYKVVTIFKIYF